jgi:hypothetical protein
MKQGTRDLILIAAFAAFGLLALVACSDAPAAGSSTQDEVSWTMPTQTTDGAALPLSDIAKTTVVWGTAPGGPYTAGTQDVAAPATSVTLSRSGAGTRCYKINVTTTAAKGSVPSAFSPEGCKTVFAAPNPPTNLTVQ